MPRPSIPTSSQVIGPAIGPPSESLLQVLRGTAAFDPAAVCSVDSVQSVSPPPLKVPTRPRISGASPGLPASTGMADLGRYYRGQMTKQN